MVWTLIEPGVAIVASSLVTIRPLLHAMRIKGFVSTENSNTLRYGVSGRGGASAGMVPAKRANNNRGMPGYGPGDLALIDMQTDGGTLAAPSPIPPKEPGATVHTANTSDSSLPLPRPVKGAVYSGREVAVDELPLANNRG